jgi:hypothetical protein
VVMTDVLGEGAPYLTPMSFSPNEYGFPGSAFRLANLGLAALKAGNR